MPVMRHAERDDANPGASDVKAEAIEVDHKIVDRPFFFSRKNVLFLSPIILLPIVAIIIILMVFAREMWIQFSMIEDIEARFGGKIVGEIHYTGGDYEEAITFVDIIHLSAFENAGIANNDVVITDKTIGNLLIELDQPAGSVIKLEVVDGGNGPPLYQRPRRKINLIAP